MRTVALTLTPRPHLLAPPVSPYFSLMITPPPGSFRSCCITLSARIYNSVIRTEALSSGEREILDERASDTRLDDPDSLKRSTKHSFGLIVYFPRCISTSSYLVWFLEGYLTPRGGGASGGEG